MSTPRVDNNEKPEAEKKRLKAKEETEEDAEEEALEVESTAGGIGGSGG